MKSETEFRVEKIFTNRFRRADRWQTAERHGDRAHNPNRIQWLWRSRERGSSAVGREPMTDGLAATVTLITIPIGSSASDGCGGREIAFVAEGRASASAPALLR